jgi:hypothetical protein
MRALAIIAILAGTAVAQPNDGQRTKTVFAKQNDSVSMLASEYYGDRNKFPFIITENKLKPKPLVQGQRLRIPMLREITTVPGDTFLTLAEHLLGDHRRAGVLAELNGMNSDDVLAAGTPLIVPFTVQYTAEAKESFAQIAAVYFNDPKLGEALKTYNFPDQPAKTVLEKGETISIPSFKVKMQPEKLAPPDAESKLRRDKRRDNNKLAATAIPIARHAWKIGDYTTVKKSLESIDLAFVEIGPAIEAAVLLGSAQVAFGDADGAQATFRKVLERKPSHTLRKVDHSPKILAVWAKADGSIE